VATRISTSAPVGGGGGGQFVSDVFTVGIKPPMHFVCDTGWPSEPVWSLSQLID
jgi:hypothetical protein